jgi:hypothetical protein
MEARLAFVGHALMENRSGLLIDACLTKVSGHAERFGQCQWCWSRGVIRLPTPVTWADGD